MFSQPRYCTELFRTQCCCCCNTNCLFWFAFVLAIAIVCLVGSKLRSPKIGRLERNLTNYFMTWAILVGFESNQMCWVFVAKSCDQLGRSLLWNQSMQLRAPLFSPLRTNWTNSDNMLGDFHHTANKRTKKMKDRQKNSLFCHKHPYHLASAGNFSDFFLKLWT